MRWLYDERLKREQVQGALAATVDTLADKLQTACLLVEKFQRDILDLQFELNKHIKTHRLFELVVLALAAGAGGFLAKWLGLGGK
jgi:D-serine deaminase-like pyridoxal phosphate-dependent protein